MKNIFISFIAFFVFVLSGSAQQIVVLDKSDLQPISQVNITNVSKTTMVITDNLGNADLSTFAANDSLFFSHVAFQPYGIAKSRLGSVKNTIYLTENVIKLDEVVFTANRVEEKKTYLPYKIEVIPAKEISFNNPPTTAIMLEQTGNVFVQQSQLGGGSPVLRGFEANKVLLVVDGVRMNNAIYRSGHLQSTITVDPNMLSSTEILYGPGSVIYGSDALGGVISYATIDPTLSTNGKMQVHGNLVARYATADQEKTGGVNLKFGWKKWAALLNFSYSDFDNLREGQTRNPFYGDWGKCLYYAERINGKDSMLVNPHPQVQRPSGYSQYNFMGKVMFRPGQHSRYLLNFQYSNSSNIPRYDRLSEMSSSTGKLKYAEWYYGPQERLLASLKADYTLKGIIFDRASVIVSFQDIGEDRINRTFGKSMKKFNLEKVSVYSLTADFEKKLASKDDLRYGIAADYNNVVSRAHQENITTGLITYDLPTRYPDDKANMASIAAYASNIWNINRVFAFSQGLRFSYVALNAAYSDTMMAMMKFPFSSTIAQRNSALNGYLGFVATPGYDWKFSLVGSSGFRAPNIDDLTKLNESNSQDKVIIVPNPDLKPEYAYNLEFTVAKTVAGCVRLEGSAFYTWLNDALVVAPTTYNGQDSILFDGVMCQVQSSTNAGKAYVYGFQGNLLAQVTRSFSIISNLTYTMGKLDENDTPLDHIPPVYGMTSFQLELKKFKGSFYVMYNGWKRISQYSPSGEDNEVYATPYGTPAWYTLNIKASYQVMKYLNVEMGLENILDEHYRKFASGISSPGRNFIIALRGTL
jgi:hemoglobin/transferrin/lactoferrin receptor protein